MFNLKQKQLYIALVLGVVWALPQSALATNGYFSHGYGTKNKGLVGAGVALPQSAMTAATNPAGMVQVGDRMDLGAAIFSPSPRSYTASPPNPLLPVPQVNADGSTVESDNDFFLIPHFARNWMLDPDSSIGVTVYGNGGMNTEYPANATPGGLGTFGNPLAPSTGAAGVDLMQLFINTTYARKFGTNASWGISAIFALQRFELTGAQNFAGLTNDPAKLSNNGVEQSTGFGAKLGVMGEVAPGITLGASYQSKLSMSEFDDYAGLFAEKGGFDIPATWTVGLAWETSPKSVLVFDIQGILYGDIASIANPVTNITNCPAFGGADSSYCFGGSNGPGFGWEDMTIYKLGYQWQTSPQWTWRVGFSTGDQPIPEEEVMLNIFAPAVIEQHVTFGFTRQLSGDSEINFALAHALNNDIEGPNPFNPAQTIKLEMKQFEAELSWGKRF